MNLNRAEVWADLRSLLLAWYRTNGRRLPWRDLDDPYPVWISEVMLQQTQVQTVLPFYQRWLQVFPTVFHLAEADLQAVLKQWAGLGYYARARNLHQAAQIIVKDYGGAFPKTVSDWLALPGVGRTTAGAILSSAFNQPVSILDGNVKRVLARLTALERPPNAVLPQLWQLSDQLLDPDQSRDFNQALMDLGATLCTRHQPDCRRCPWQGYCQAYNRGVQNELPKRKMSAPLPHQHIGVAVISNDQGQILIDRRPAQGLLGGLWEFPGGKIEPGETVQACIEREIQEEIGIAIAVGDPLITIDHAYTHLRVTLQVYLCRYLSGTPQALGCEEVRWVALDQLDQYPFPKANTDIIAALRRHFVPGTFP